MALTVEDGTGLANADSYLSAADATAYLAAHGNPSAWAGADLATQEEALRLATQYLDLEYGGSWKGFRVRSVQALDWPRCAVSDRDDFEVASDAVPQQIKDSAAEAASRHLTETGRLMPDIAAPGDIKSEKVKVGPIVEEVEYVGGKSQVPSFRKIDALVRELVTHAASEITLERA